MYGSGSNRLETVQSILSPFLWHPITPASTIINYQPVPIAATSNSAKSVVSRKLLVVYSTHDS